MKVSSYLAIALSAVGSAEAFSYSKAYDYMKQGGEWAYNNPGKAVCVATGAAGVGMVAAPMAVGGAALSAAGLGSLGPVAGGYVAGIWGAGPVAGSVTAIAQSAAMGGYGVPIVSGIVQSVGGAVTLGSSYGFFSSSKKDD